MSPLNITQPLGIWSIMATIRWCPIFPKWDSYQPLWWTCCPVQISDKPISHLFNGVKTWLFLEKTIYGGHFFNAPSSNTLCNFLGSGCFLLISPWYFPRLLLFSWWTVKPVPAQCTQRVGRDSGAWEDGKMERSGLVTVGDLTQYLGTKSKIMKSCGKMCEIFCF